MSENTDTEVVAPVEEPEVAVPRYDDSVETKDEKPGTFINEALWRKVFFKILANFVYVLGLAVITDGIVAFDFTKFITGLQVIILPIIWSALDAQSRNKEIQDRMASDLAMKAERAVYEKQKNEADVQIAELKSNAEEKQLEIYRLKAVLMAKTDNVEAMNAAVKKAEELIKTADSLG
jgi:hypothetical protein